MVAIILLASAGLFLIIAYRTLGEKLYEEAQPTGVVREFTLIAEERGFNGTSGEPTLMVDIGDTVRIALIVPRGVAHGLAIPEFDVRTSLISNGVSEVMEFIINRVSSFRYYCPVPGHRQRRMEGIIVVQG